jgi:penicillin amidase
VSRDGDDEDDDRAPLVEHHRHIDADGVAADADAVIQLEDEATSGGKPIGGEEKPTRSGGIVCCCRSSLSRVQPRVLRGRKRVLLSTASFIALLTLYYTYVLPALWHCSEYFTLMLMLGIVEGLLLFFAAIWHAYTSKHSARRVAHRSSKSRSDDEYSETFSERSDYFDYSEGGTSSAVEMSDALVDSAPAAIGASSPPPLGNRVAQLSRSLADDVDSSDGGGTAPASPLPPPRGRRSRVRRKRAPPRRRASSDFDSENAEDEADDDFGARPLSADEEDDEDEDDVPRPLANSTGSVGGDASSEPTKKRGILRRCVALRARTISFNFCLTCFGIVNACVILFLVSAVFYLRDFTLPSVSGVLTVPGLQATATVQRDTNGVIHVRAENEHDLFFAQGFVSAQDRLFQIEFQRRLGAGRLSERLGNATISLDRYFRTLGLRRAAELAWPTLTQQTRDGVVAFVDGVNAFLASQPPLPIEFSLLEYTRQDIEPFTAIDVVQWSKVMAYDLSMNMHDELERFELAQNVSAERMAQFFPDYDTTAFPTVTDANDLKVDLLARHVAQVRAAVSQRSRSAADSEPASPNVAAAVVAPANGDAPADVAARVMHTNEPVEAPSVSHLEGLLSRYAGWRRGARASNNWAVHGMHTRSGRPLLANDPHLSFSTPAIWLLMHLQSPTINTIGAAFASSPGVILGRNDYIAWGVTNVGTDVQDLYVLDTVNRTTYRHNGELRTFVLRNETILVKRPLLLKPYEIELVVRETVHGPVVSDHVVIKGADARDLALRWSALDATDSSMNAFNGVMRAQNWTAFRDAVALLSTPASNFVYADVSGNIGYQTTGVVPVRVAQHDGRMPVSGNGSFDWLGYAPFTTLPSVLNPESGYVVSANNRVSPASFDASLILNNGDWSPGFRARRITELLHQHRRLTVDDMKAMQMDRNSGLFDDLAPLIAGVLRTNLLTDRERDWLSRLAHWDGSLTAESREGTVFLAWIEQLLDSARGELGAGHRPSILFVHYTFGRFVDGELPYDTVCLDDLPPAARTASSRTAAPMPLNGTAAASSTDNSTRASEVYSNACVGFAARAFGRALQELYDNWSDVVALGKRQQVVFEHEILKDTQLGCFYERHSDVGGDPWTVNPSGGVLRGAVGSVRKAEHGASYRQVVDFSDFSQSVFMSTIGQGEQPMSPFFDTYLERWLTGKYNPMMQEGVYSSLQLVPADTKSKEL